MRYDRRNGFDDRRDAVRPSEDPDPDQPEQEHQGECVLLL